MDTPERILGTARTSFAHRGFGATSLDALAEQLGVRKQTILYHFGSKEGLLDAVIDRAVATLSTSLLSAADRAPVGPARVRALVDAVFRVAADQPELLELLREVNRLGPPASTRLVRALAPLVDRAAGVVPRETLLGAYAMVIGMATEVEVLRSLGIEPDLPALRRRRRQLLRFVAADSLVRP